METLLERTTVWFSVSVLLWFADLRRKPTLRGLPATCVCCWWYVNVYQVLDPVCEKNIMVYFAFRDLRNIFGFRKNVYFLGGCLVGRSGIGCLFGHHVCLYFTSVSMNCFDHYWNSADCKWTGLATGTYE